MPDIEYAWIMLKEYDPLKGNVRQRYRMPPHGGWNGIAFECNVVHKLDREAAEWLHKNVRQLDGEGSERSPLAFHIWYSEADAARGVRDLHMEKLGRVRHRGRAVSPSTPPELKEAVLTSIGDPAPVHELEEMLPIEEFSEDDPVDLSTIKVEPGYKGMDLASVPVHEPEPPKKTRKKPGPKPGSRRKKT